MHNFFLKTGYKKYIKLFINYIIIFKYNRQLPIHFFTFTCLLMYMINILVISGRACSRRMTGAQVLALMDDSDMELSDSDCELDVGDTDSSNGADDTGDSESEEEVARTPASKRRVMWKKTDDFTPDCVDLSAAHQQWSPVRYFEQYIDDNDYATMADFTNRHFIQATGRVLSSSTIEKFVGISLMMGCLGLKRLQQATRIHSIADCMQRDRFSKLRNHFTVVDNNVFSEDDKSADRMWKVRPFVERIRRTCLTLPREANVSNDEQMISFTGRCPSRQYVPRKPNPTGLKNFVLAGASGLVLDFELYQGAGTFDRYDIDGKKAGQGSGAVLRLCESLSNGHRLYCDRFFTSLPLINHMLTRTVLDELTSWTIIGRLL